jgi:hypothetical protein
MEGGKHATIRIDDIMDLLLCLAEPEMSLSGQELYGIENAWTEKPNASGLGALNGPFLVSCRIAYTLDEPSALSRDLFVIAVKTDALRLLWDTLLQLTGDSAELRDHFEAVAENCKAPQPGQCTSAIQLLCTYSAQQNIELASKSTSLTCTIW